MRPVLGNCVFQSASLGRKFKIGVSCHTNVGRDQRSPLEAQEVKLYFYPLALIFGGLLHLKKKKLIALSSQQVLALKCGPNGRRLGRQLKGP